ncbi:hypothetical protein BST61_g3475 [Cercospora zeina]
MDDADPKSKKSHFRWTSSTSEPKIGKRDMKRAGTANMETAELAKTFEDQADKDDPFNSTMAKIWRIDGSSDTVTSLSIEPQPFRFDLPREIYDAGTELIMVRGTSTRPPLSLRGPDPPARTGQRIFLKSLRGTAAPGNATNLIATNTVVLHEADALTSDLKERQMEVTSKKSLLFNVV